MRIRVGVRAGARARARARTRMRVKVRAGAGARARARALVRVRVRVRARARARVHLGAGEAERAKVPQHQVVLGALGGELVALADEKLREGLRVGADLLGVGLELGRGDLLELRGQAGDLVVVRST